MIVPHDTNGTDAIALLMDFLTGLCSNNEDGGFVWQLAKAVTRWSLVDRLLTEMDRAELHCIAFSSGHEGFSAGNLKAHYVLDEDFINDGSAYILFALVGSTWTHVISVSDQNRFTTVSVWLAGEVH
ncbi:hypothetical protein D3C75_972650 [compost metagenome]